METTPRYILVAVPIPAPTATTLLCPVLPASREAQVRPAASDSLGAEAVMAATAAMDMRARLEAAEGTVARGCMAA